MSHIKVHQWLRLSTLDHFPQSHCACADTSTQKGFDSVVLRSNSTMLCMSEMPYGLRRDKRIVPPYAVDVQQEVIASLLCNRDCALGPELATHGHQHHREGLVLSLRLLRATWMWLAGSYGRQREAHCRAHSGGFGWEGNPERKMRNAKE